MRRCVISETMANINARTLSASVKFPLEDVLQRLCLDADDAEEFEIGERFPLAPLANLARTAQRKFLSPKLVLRLGNAMRER